MAVALATQACDLSSWRDWRCLEALAAAHAAQTNFQQAIRILDRSIGLASADKRAELAACRAKYVAQLSEPRELNDVKQARASNSD